MEKSQEYFDGLVEKGFSEIKAFQHTLEYFPDFRLNEDSENENPKPEPPSGFDEDVTSVPLPKKDEEQKREFDYGEIFNIMNDKIKYFGNKATERKFIVTASVITGIIIVIFLFTLIPEKTDPIVGKWIKSDGQEWTFDSDGGFDDQGSDSSSWRISDDTLIIETYFTDNSGKTKMIQYIRFQISNDQNAMWMKWQNITVDGVEQQLSSSSDGCVIILNDSYLESNLQFNKKSDNYQEQPSWCSETD